MALKRHTRHGNGDTEAEMIKQAKHGKLSSDKKEIGSDDLMRALAIRARSRKKCREQSKDGFAPRCPLWVDARRCQAVTDADGRGNDRGLAAEAGNASTKMPGNAGIARPDIDPRAGLLIFR